MPKPKILVTREVFDETLDYLREHCEVDSNQEDVALTPDAIDARAGRAIECRWVKNGV